MAAEFVVERWPDPEDKFTERTLGRAKMLVRVARFVLSRRLRIRDRLDGEPRSEWGAWLAWLAGLQAIARRTQREPVGTRFFVQRDSDNAQLRIWKVARAEELPDLGAAPDLEAIHWYLFKKWGDRIRSGGLWFCRFVSGTDDVSRHGFKARTWKGAAEDIFVVTPNTMEFLFEVAEDLVAQAKAGKLNARDIICGDKRWRAINGFREERYDGIFHRHIHVDVPGGEACDPLAA